MLLICRLFVGFKAMRFALGTPDFDEEIIMKNINYRLVRERVYLAIALIKLAQELLTLLNMAFNYHPSKCTRHAFC
jgi:hypothetical protein